MFITGKMSSFVSILEREPMPKKSAVDNKVLSNGLDNSPDNIIQDLDKTVISKTPLDFSRDVNIEHNSSNNEIKYREFQSNINNLSGGKDNDTSSEIVCNEHKEVMVQDVDGNNYGGNIILHIIDNIYSYGRTLIENNYFNFANNDDFNLVYPNIYIGNYSTSTNLELLQNVGITHIISVISTFNPPFPDKFKYLHIKAYDDQSQDLSQYFVICNTFIGNVLKEGGKILIHCMVGRSRSVTIFLAFLINIICGNFNQCIVNLCSDYDVSDEAEYKKFGKFKNKLNIKYNNPRADTVNDNISTFEYIKPELSTKYLNLITYKKETMISEVEELCEKYKLFKKEINIRSTDVLLNKSMEHSLEQIKTQFANNFITQILKYIKNYRTVALPNPYFINQLTYLLIQ